MLGLRRGDRRRPRRCKLRFSRRVRSAASHCIVFSRVWPPPRLTQCPFLLQGRNVTLHKNAGLCGGGINDELYDHDGLPWTWSACWTACLDKYADALAAIDGPQNGLCYCQDACTHTYDCGVATAMMTWSDFVVPDTCTYSSDSGILYVELDAPEGGNEEYRGFTATWSLVSNDTDAHAGAATVTCGGSCGCHQSATMSAGTFSSFGTLESAQNTPAA